MMRWTCSNHAVGRWNIHENLALQLHWRSCDAVIVQQSCCTTKIYTRSTTLSVHTMHSSQRLQGGRIRGGCTVVNTVTVYIRSMQRFMYQVSANVLIGRRHERLPLRQTTHSVWRSMPRVMRATLQYVSVPSHEYQQYLRLGYLEHLKHSQFIAHDSSRILLRRFVKNRRRSVLWTYRSSKNDILCKTEY